MLRVVELFAGVGGFRIGLEGVPGSTPSSNSRVVWANQWEPSTKKQHAAEIYCERWGLKASGDDPEVFVGETGDVFVNKDISTVDSSEIPEHDLICGGFPCQDYSVAKTSNKAKGIQGKKGVLWWEIHRILSSKKSDYVLLENVDRLLKSPTSQRGRDFAVMLASLDELGYVVEWRSFAASDYGFPQRRTRVYILAHGPGTPGHTALTGSVSPLEWLSSEGVMARAFPIKSTKEYFGLPQFNLRKSDGDDLADVSEAFNTNRGNKSSPFGNAGVMVGGVVWTTKVESEYSGPLETLGDILVTPGKVDDSFIIPPIDVLREKGWRYLKGGKSEARKGTGGFTYEYKEGPVTFPDALDRPSRTMITGEGGASPSRFKHVVVFRPTKTQVQRLGLSSEETKRVRDDLGLTKSSWIRRLVPVELERLNGFPDDHTEGAPDGRRAFFMGNALVTGIVSLIAGAILDNS